MPFWSTGWFCSRSAPPTAPASRNRALGTLRNRVHFVALATALLFACHPVQTQAVTYIVQRFASLATLLFLLALTCYIQARLLVLPKKASGTSAPLSWRLARSGLYTLSLAAAVLAMKTKEIAFTLPVVVALYELSFLRPEPSGGQAAPYRRIIGLLPLALTLLIIPLSMQGRGVEEMLSSFRATERHLPDRLSAHPVPRHRDLSAAAVASRSGRASTMISLSTGTFWNRRSSSPSCFWRFWQGQPPSSWSALVPAGDRSG